MSKEDGQAFLAQLKNLPLKVRQVIAHSKAIEKVAIKYSSFEDFFYLGRQYMYPTSLEAALKLKEISYLNAIAYPAGEMKHGPSALVDESVPVIVLALRGPGYEKALSNLEEVRARGGKIIALATMGDSRIGDIADDVILVPDVPEELQPIAVSVPLQLLAYHFADLKGTDVDQPRNLAKSVTVE